MKPWDEDSSEAPKLALRKQLVLCEDTKSSKDYFEAFGVSGKLIEFEGLAYSPDRLVEEAIRRKEYAANRKKNYSKIWCVFDKDEFEVAHFNRAFDLVKRHRDIVPVWANECFELWYILHYDYRDTPICRHTIGSELRGVGRLGRKYSKDDKTVYASLKSRTEKAIANSKRLFKANSHLPVPWSINPSTNAHELIEELRLLKGLGVR